MNENERARKTRAPSLKLYVTVDTEGPLSVSVYDDEPPVITVSASDQPARLMLVGCECARQLAAGLADQVATAMELEGTFTWLRGQLTAQSCMDGGVRVYDGLGAALVLASIAEVRSLADALRKVVESYEDRAPTEDDHAED